MKERRDAVLTVKVPPAWLDAIDKFGDAIEDDSEEVGKRSRTVRRILRRALLESGLLVESGSTPPPRPKNRSGEHRAFARK